MATLLARVTSVFPGSNKVSVEGATEDRDVPLVSPYGVGGMPPVGTPVQLVLNAGSRHQVVVVGTIVETAPTLEPGESHLFSQAGARVHCRQDGTVVINEGTKSVARVDDLVEVVINGVVHTGKITSGNESLKA